MSFPLVRLFENINFQEGSLRIALYHHGGRNHFITSPTRARFFGKHPQQAQSEHDVSMIDWVTKIVSEATFGQPDQNPTQQKILDELRLLKGDGGFLTIGRIRKIYRELVASRLEGVRRVASEAHPRSRIIWDGAAKTYRVSDAYFSSWRKTLKRENQGAWEKYRSTITSEWGAQRVERVLKRYQLDQRMAHGKPLLAKNVNDITLGLADFQEEDLRNALSLIKQFCRGEFELASLPERIQRKLRELYPKTEMQDRLAAQFDNDTPFEKLSEELFITLQLFVHVDRDELELAFQGQRIEGVVRNHPEPLSAMFINDLAYKDQERLQLYQSLLHLSDIMEPSQYEEAFAEILAKSMVKKDMTEGTLIPAPHAGERRWYQIANRTMTGRAKFFYHLVQANESVAKKLPDILLYRNSSTSPAFPDSFTSFVIDTYPFAPPGYLWKRVAEEVEMEILHQREDRPIQIIGHSLGGTEAQVLALRAIRKGGKPIQRLPNRDIKMMLFDAPAIRRSDCDYFNKWAEEHPDLAKRLAIHYHFSRGDLFPGGGDTHLGYKLDKDLMKDFSCHILSSYNPNDPVMRLHPHERIYNKRKEGVDFKKRRISIESYDQQKWRKPMEIFRRFVGTLFCYPVMALGFLKRFLIGWRGGRGVLQQLLAG